MKVVVGLVIVLLTLLAAGDVIADDGFGLSTFKSQRYGVHTDLPPEQAKRLAAHMDKVYDEYERRLSAAGFSGSGSPAMPLYLIASEQKYMKILGSMGVNGAGTAGMFFYADDKARLAGWLTNNSESQMIETLQHEGFHQFAYLKIGDKLPVWANEGLAVYFQHALLVGNRLVLNEVDGGDLATVKRAVAENRHLHFDELLNMSSRQWVSRVNKGDTSTHLMYAESWSIVHFLVNADNGRFERPFMQYLRYLHGGTNSREAFAKAFGSSDYTPFEEAWKKYIEQLGPDPLTLAVQRTRFLAAGLANLAKAGVTITTMEQLKSELQKIDFRYKATLEDMRTTLSASDDANFQPPSDRGRPSRWTLKPSGDPALPPTLSNVGLAAAVNVRWSLNAKKEPVYSIELR